MYSFPAHKLGYQNSSPLEAFVIGLEGLGVNNTIKYLNANQFQFGAGAPSYSFGGPPNASPLRLGFEKGDQLLVNGPPPNGGKWFTFVDPSTLTVMETIGSSASDYYFQAVRKVNNGVLTQTGREWLTRLCTWSSIGDPDVPLTEDRIRWIGLGSGGFPMAPGVLTLEAAIEYATGLYLAQVSGAPSFPTVQSTRYNHVYSASEVSISSPALISEVGLFVDQSPSLNLDPAVGNNPPVLYKSFNGLMKSSDFSLLLDWTLKF
jgi:hypothetical protein